MPLSPSSITDAALAILSEYGLGDLSMRRLARDLDVQPSALYWHVANKQEVFVLVAERFAVEVDSICHGGETLIEALSTMRGVLLRYRDGAEIMSLAYALKGAAVLPGCVRAAASPEQIHCGVVFVLGFVSHEQYRAGFGLPAERPARTFEASLDALGLGRG